MTPDDDVSLATMGPLLAGIAGTLSSYEKAMLSALDEDGGFLTKHVAQHAFGSDGRQRGSNAHYALKRLELAGLVRRLDGEKPVCWCRTRAGTEALS